MLCLWACGLEVVGLWEYGLVFCVFGWLYICVFEGLWLCGFVFCVLEDL